MSSPPQASISLHKQESDHHQAQSACTNSAAHHENNGGYYDDDPSNHHHSPDNYIPGNPHMIRIASHTAYRTGARPNFAKKASWINTSRSISLSPSNSASNSRTASPVGTPVGARSRSPVDQFRGISSTSIKMGKQEGIKNEPPKHQMVHFPKLTSEVRRFGDFRRVLHTGLYSQLVAMEIPVGGDIGEEVHTVDQILLFTSGTGLAQVAGTEQAVGAGDVVVVPAGTHHQFLNTSKTDPLELVTVYSPAEHDPRSVHKTKAEGDEEEDTGRDEAPAWSRRSKTENEQSGAVKLEGGPYNE